MLNAYGSKRPRLCENSIVYGPVGQLCLRVEPKRACIYADWILRMSLENEKEVSTAWSPCGPLAYRGLRWIFLGWPFFALAFGALLLACLHRIS